MNSVVFFFGAAFVIASAVVAGDNSLACVKELAVPGYRGIVSGMIPAVVSVRVLIGKDGKATSTEYGEGQQLFRYELDEYLKDKTKYSDECAGETITFTVRYLVEGEWVNYKPSWETRICLPSDIILICHPLGVTNDPVRQLEIQPKGKAKK